MDECRKLTLTCGQWAWTIICGNPQVVNEFLKSHLFQNFIVMNENPAVMAVQIADSKYSP